MTDDPRPTTEDKLRLDLGPEAERLLPVLRRLDSFAAPGPSSADTARLLAALQSTLAPHPASRTALRFASSWPLLLLRTQFHLIQRELWLASALVLSIGTFVTLATGGARRSPETLPLVLIAPIVTALGVGLLYGPVGEPSLELELATPVSPRLLLLARLALVFGFNLALSLLASLLASYFIPALSPAAIILAWLAPMTFLSALAFFLSVLCFDPMAGVTASLILWALQIFKTLGGFDGWPLVARLPGLFDIGLRSWLFALAAAIGLAALWAAGRDERWSRPTE